MTSHRIEPARPDDLDAVLAIEVQSQPNPWPREALEQELALPVAGFYVARLERPLPVVGGIAGFITTWVVEESLQVLSVAVHPLARRRGIGLSLLDHAEREAMARGGRQAFLEVRRSNQGAIRLYLGHGYEEIGLRRRYYSDNDEDAIVMRKALPCGRPTGVPPAAPRAG